MFSKKKIETILTNYKEKGILPNIFKEDTKLVDDYEKMAFIILLEKSVEIDKKPLKEKIEKSLNNESKTTEYLKIAYKEASLRITVTEDGKKFLKENHSIYLKETSVKGSFSWTLR